MLGYFIVALVVILIFLVVVGAVIARRAPGVLIDSRNKVSLSQFQIVLWTWILLSGFITIALARVFAGVEDPLGVTWDQHLWGLLGISLGSAVSAGLSRASRRERSRRHRRMPLLQTSSPLLIGKAS